MPENLLKWTHVLDRKDLQNIAYALRWYNEGQKWGDGPRYWREHEMLHIPLIEVLFKDRQLAIDCLIRASKLEDSPYYITLAKLRQPPGEDHEA